MQPGSCFWSTTTSTPPPYHCFGVRFPFDPQFCSRFGRFQHQAPPVGEAEGSGPYPLRAEPDALYFDGQSVTVLDDYDYGRHTLKKGARAFLLFTLPPPGIFLCEKLFNAERLRFKENHSGKFLNTGINTGSFKSGVQFLEASLSTA